MKRGHSHQLMVARPEPERHSEMGSVAAELRSRGLGWANPDVLPMAEPHLASFLTSPA
jgi:hypothetical protein